MSAQAAVVAIVLRLSRPRQPDGFFKLILACLHPRCVMLLSNLQRRVTQENRHLLDWHALFRSSSTANVSRKTMHGPTRDVRKFEDALKCSFPDLDRSGRQAPTVPEEVFPVVAPRSLERIDARYATGVNRYTRLSRAAARLTSRDLRASRTSSSV